MFVTDQPGRDLARLELRHRRHARVEDRIRAAKATGLANLPFDAWRRNAVWLELVLAAQDLTCWLQSLLTGVPYDEPPEAELVAMEGEDGPWVQQLSEELRDALADAHASRLPAVAEQWVRTKEFWDQPPAAEVLPFLVAVTALARRARQAGERLYCWSCL